MSQRTIIAMVTLASSALAGGTARAATLSAAELVEGDLVITEIQRDPSAVPDYYGEWFEMYNASGSDVDLEGLYVWDGGTDDFTVVGSVVLAAGDYAVFSLNDKSEVNGGIPVVDYKYASSTYRLGNGVDQIYLVNDSFVIDAVEYDGSTFPNTPGSAMSLDPDALDATSNDAASSWCDATSTYGLGDFGTPGAANDVCADSGGLAALVEGDLVITEIMKDPTKVADYYGEYFEVYNASGMDIDLEGLVISDLGTDSFTVMGSLPLASGDTALFAVAGTGLNGGIPSYDYDYLSSTFRLNNGSDAVVLSYGGVVFDSVAYDTSFPNTPGYALSLNPSLMDATSNDAAASWCPAYSVYGLGDFGTPDSANDGCSEDGDGDGYSVGEGDCDDADPGVYPGATETYDLVDEDCDGLVDESLVQANDVVITEIMSDPAKVSDNLGEWFELTNLSDRTLDLVGWMVQGSDGDHLSVSGSLLVAPGESLVFGVSGDTGVNGGVPVDYAYSRSTFKLTNSGDDLWVTLDDAVVSSVAYDASWPLDPGFALNQDARYSGTAYDADAAAWCRALSTYGLGDRGTPGSANDDCFILGADFLIEGDLVITEIMKDPAMVPDYDGEWFEVYNASGYPLDMMDLVVMDDGTDLLTIDDPLLIGADGYAVLVIEADSALNGGISAYDYVFSPSKLRFGNGADSVYIYDGVTLIDGVAYDNGLSFFDGAGASISLDPSATNTASNDDGASWCGASSSFGLGDAGTPGSENDVCP